MQARRYPIPPLAATMSDDEVRIGTSIGTSSNPLGEITNLEISRHGIARHSMPTGVHQNVSVTGHKTFDDTPHSNGKVETLMALPAYAFLVPLLCEPRSAVFQAKHEALQDSKANNTGPGSADEVQWVASVRYWRSTALPGTCAYHSSDGLASIKLRSMRLPHISTLDVWGDSANESPAAIVCQLGETPQKELP